VSLEVTNNAKQAANRNEIQPSMVMKFDRSGLIFGSVGVYEYIRIGMPDLYIGDDWVIGGYRLLGEQSPYITFNTGTTSKISQKLDPSRGQGTTVPGMVVSMVDKNEEISKLMSPGLILSDPIGEPVTIYSGFKDTSFPQDFNVVFKGICQSYQCGAGYINMILSSAEDKKRLNVVSRTTSKLSSAIDNSQTTIPVYSTEFYTLPSDICETFIKIGDELIKYTGKLPGSFTGCSRAQNGTIAEAQDIDTDVEQVIRLQGNPLDIALKIMLSDADTYYIDGLEASAVNFINPSLSIPNAIIFNDVHDMNVEHGITVGDIVDIYDSAIPANNLTGLVVLDLGTFENGSYIILNSTLTDEFTTTAKIKARCKYNTLPFGLGMYPNEVDIDQHEFVRDTYLAGETMDLYLSDESSGKEFIERELYLPKACFSVPRKGRASVAHHAGPFPNYEIVTIDTDSVVNPSALKIERSSTENFFNQVVVEYNYDPVQERYLSSKQVTVPTTVQSKVKRLNMQSKGLRDSVFAESQIERTAEKLLKRYSQGAEFIKGVRLKFGQAYRLEIGDTVLVDYKDLQLTDIKTGTRAGSLRVMEVQNKVIDNKTGEITIDLVNSIYSPTDRFGTISPSSLIDNGSTTNKLVLQRSWNTQGWQKETDKWQDYIGQNIIIHNEDWSQVHTSKILGLDDSEPQGMSIQSIVVTPSNGWIVQCPAYPFTENSDDEAYWKTRHGFMCNQAIIAANPSANVITLSPSDVLYARLGMRIRVHNYDYSQDSGELEITNITGNDITLSANLTFYAVNDYADILGFIDGGYAYRIL